MLGRIKTWTDGETLFSVDQNGEFNNILNNPLTLISPTTGVIDFNSQAHTNLLPSAVLTGPAVSRVSGLVATLSSQVGTFAAQGFVMRTGTNMTWNVTATSSFGASVGTAGPAAGGRDVAGTFSSTEVHWYAISTGINSTAPACVVSTKTPPTGPTLPAGYTGWTYLGGSIYSSASTALPSAHKFRGSKAFYDGAVAALTAGTATVQTSVSLAGFIPANALAVNLLCIAHVVAPGGGSAANSVSLRHTTGVDYANLVVGDAAPSFSSLETMVIEIPNVSNQLFYLNTGAGGPTTADTTINVLGYTIPNGDV